jgi:hypothetical protein
MVGVGGCSQRSRFAGGISVLSRFVLGSPLNLVQPSSCGMVCSRRTIPWVLVRVPARCRRAGAVEQTMNLMRLNMSANTDPQQHKAASPQMLVVRLPLRYVS